MAIKMPASVGDLSTKRDLTSTFYKPLLASTLCIDIFAISSPVMPKNETEVIAMKRNETRHSLVVHVEAKQASAG